MNEPALKDQISCLEEAYQKMNPEGKVTLDQLVGQLAEAHHAIRKFSDDRKDKVFDIRSYDKLLL